MGSTQAALRKAVLSDVVVEFCLILPCLGLASRELGEKKDKKKRKGVGHIRPPEVTAIHSS